MVNGTLQKMYFVLPKVSFKHENYHINVEHGLLAGGQLDAGTLALKIWLHEFK